MLPTCNAERAVSRTWRTQHRAAHSRGPRTPPEIHLEARALLGRGEASAATRRSNLKHGHYSAEAKRVRREARQQYRLLRQLIAAGNEDDVLDLISSV
jgi:hypothetical protein